MNTPDDLLSCECTHQPFKIFAEKKNHIFPKKNKRDFFPPPGYLDSGFRIDSLLGRQPGMKVCLPDAEHSSVSQSRCGAQQCESVQQERGELGRGETKAEEEKKRGNRGERVEHG